MKDFLHAVADHLDASGVPAAGEVAAGLRPVIRDASPGHVAIPHLADALSQSGRHALAGHVARLANRLFWEDNTHWHDIPLPFRFEFRYCELVGPDGAIPADGFRMGLYVQYPNSFYPLHNHEAEEMYFPISGTARWWRDGVADAPAPPGTVIRHAPFERHATRTFDEPLLAIWTWTGMIGPGTYACDPGPPD